MRRREFLAAIAFAAAWPRSAGAQSANKIPTIGFLGTATPSAWSRWTTAFVQRLRELGWEEGRTVAIEYRWANGRNELYPEIAAEFVRRKVDVIVTSGGAVLAAKQATSAIPIVFGIAIDPVGAGMVASLARPGGNVTGLSLQSPDLAAKRTELLREVIPGLRRLAIMANAANRNTLLELREVEEAARAFGLGVEALEVRQAGDIAPAIEGVQERAEALYLCGDPFVIANHNRINDVALRARLPVVGGFPELVEAGSLLSYGPSFPDLFRRAAEKVDLILRGAKPGDLPVEQPTKFELFINVKTATMLGLTIPPSILARADEVIE